MVALSKLGTSIYSEESLTLTPKIDLTISQFINEKTRLFELSQALGSPLNILFPDLVSKNIESFKRAFSAYGIRGRIFFAHKANQSNSVVNKLATEEVGIDVSSVNELRHALGGGFLGERIEATGPKSIEFLTLALQHNVTISIDSIAELKQLSQLKSYINAGKVNKVLLRLSGFEAEHSRFLDKGSRFGIPFGELPLAFDILDCNRDILDLIGFAFHLDTISVSEKAVALENCIELFEEALNRGFEPHVLNIGGGYKVNYLENEDDWHSYTSALKESVIGARTPITWQSNSFGLSANNGKLRGNFNSYNYFDKQTGGEFLTELLTQQFPNIGNYTAGAWLRDNMIELWIEPGRSLVDQTGITVARVNTIRKSSRDEIIVGLNMKRQDISFLDQEIFVDPVIVHKSNSMARSKIENIPVYFAGNLCLESDMIYRHQTFLPRLPKVGDLVVFINTAGYFMDFSATNSIMQPIGNKIAVCKQENGFHWVLDDQYTPYWAIFAKEETLC